MRFAVEAGYYKDSPVDNPKGASYGKAHVTRGSSWAEYRAFRASYRAGGILDKSSDTTGFRCARSVEEKNPRESNKSLEMKTTMKLDDIGKEKVERKMASTINNDMVLIPAGKFWMGCNEKVDKDCNEDEKPYHEVYLDSYYIDRHEVTNEDLVSFIMEKENHCFGSKCIDLNDFDVQIELSDGSLRVKDNKANHPAIEVTWFGAKAFCEWKGGRLPTEAEWEKAARGTDGRVYPWGNEMATCSRAVMRDDGGDGCGRESTWPVCSKPAGNSPYGLCDMAGNASEWVNDWYYKNYYDVSSQRNPKGVNSAKYRVIRGNSWFSSYPARLRASNRTLSEPGRSDDYLGFRCVRSSVQ